MYPTLLSKIDSRHEIRQYLDWHYEQCVPLRLMFESSDGHLPAYVKGFDEAAGTIDVMCMGVQDIRPHVKVSYAVIGAMASGARFLASGQMRVNLAQDDSLTLSFPQWLDVSQSRDCYRCVAPSGHFLHFSSAEPHLNDIICRVRDVSLEGLSVDWEPEGQLSFRVGAQTDDAILQSQDNLVHLGKLRVTHITHRASHYTIGLTFDQNAPKAFGSLVLDVQRAQCLL
ncbi:MAG: hypothetical protein BWK72_18605 [Rhodoferax ferrireducens]|uniref:PilZ domain-containing protein n=1 Tax=Rhodoferax ferrireducens TaxID=192843 RepID=A0A1W9KPQ6_9BURK|nr:MAG: hypothetical protein BWK72_18605 [Rhodoferax ferrireducens]